MHPQIEQYVERIRGNDTNLHTIVLGEYFDPKYQETNEYIVATQQELDVLLNSLANNQQIAGQIRELVIRLKVLYNSRELQIRLPSNLCNLQKLIVHVVEWDITKFGYWNYLTLDMLDIPNEIGLNLEILEIVDTNSLPMLKLPSSMPVLHTLVIGCYSIKELQIPESETLTNIKIYGCIGLNELRMPKTLPCLKNLHIDDCIGAENIYLPLEMPSLEHLFIVNNMRIRFIKIPADLNNLVSLTYKNNGIFCLIVKPLHVMAIPRTPSLKHIEINRPEGDVLFETARAVATTINDTRQSLGLTNLSFNFASEYQTINQSFDNPLMSVQLTVEKLHAFFKGIICYGHKGFFNCVDIQFRQTVILLALYGDRDLPLDVAVRIMSFVPGNQQPTINMHLNSAQDMLLNSFAQEDANSVVVNLFFTTNFIRYKNAANKSLRDVVKRDYEGIRARLALNG